MNHTTASCGCSIPAIGALGSMARRVQELRPCNKPRCRSGLPKKFTDAEREAWCWLTDCGVTGWTVCYVGKRVWEMPDNEAVLVKTATYPGLVEFAKAKGMT